MTGRTSLFALALLCVVATLSTATVARAHTISLSRGDYTPTDAAVDADLVVRPGDVLLALPDLDADHDGLLSPSEVQRGLASLQATFIDTLTVSSDGAPCGGTLDSAGLDPPDGLRMRATYVCKRPPRHLAFRFGFLERLPAGHRHVASVHLPRGDVDELCVLERPGMEVDVAKGASSDFASLLRAGVEHILSGADHLAFLLALVLGGTLVRARGGAAGSESLRGNVGPLIATLTAFTVGHSVALGVATLAGMVPPTRFIEAAVALSVAYVGAENLFARSIRHRWAITLPFGFVHGFAFAGGLLPLGLPRAQLPAALLAFNLGVETGQLLVLAVLLPALSFFHARPWYPRVARALSVGILLLGLVWFAQRIA
jgi:hypothetical protein